MSIVPPKKIILAYSGGLDTSVMLHWLKATYDCDIVAYCANIGQGAELDNLQNKARETGASRLHVVDVREEFAAEFVFFAVKAQAKYEGVYLLGTSLARPLIAKKQIELAVEEDACTVAHGATGKGNDQVRFELSYYTLKPNIQVIAPWRTWPFKSRSDLLSYATKYHISVEATLKKPYSIHRNLMHISYEGGILEDPWFEPPEDIFELTKAIDHTPAHAEYVEIDFAHGSPIAINGQSFTPANLIATLNQLGSIHGIGRVDLVENRYVGIKSRGVYETPGTTLLFAAHRALESITLDREAVHLRDSFSAKIAECIYYGYWFSPEMSMYRAMIDNMQKPVNGCVRLKLHKGNVFVVGRKSPNSLYSSSLATFEKDNAFNQADAEGFIKLNALRLKTQSFT